MKRILFLALMLVMATGPSAWASLAAPGVLPDINGYEITCANDSFTPTMYFGGNGSSQTNTQGMNAEWVGLTGLPVSAGSKTTANSNIIVTTNSPSYTGSVGLYDTGGSGSSVNDFILMVSVSGQQTNNFGINLQWVNASGATQNYTYTLSNFIYGAQTWRPGPTTGMTFYPSQNVNDPSTTARLMFIDLQAGVAGTGYVPVTYSLTGLYGADVAFNMYGYSPTGGRVYPGHAGLSWTNALTTGYVVQGTAAPVPIPPAVFLFGSGLSGMFFMRRRKIIA